MTIMQALIALFFLVGVAGMAALGIAEMGSPFRRRAAERERRFEQTLQDFEKSRRAMRREQREFLATAIAYQIIRDTEYDNPECLSDMITHLIEKGDATSMRVVGHLAEYLFENPFFTERFLTES